ncbi:hypothetical protein ASE80_16780 [Pseudomonas sp. Leaf15]|uniref:hypothetical protein n=1 Tax=unclassified Pseudomonas TaxID=196821 RepID=UPI000702B756|nr:MULTISPECIES: hypothetical protein [unclassified Pseudomonas]KQM46412.1 hypothetical protein ASE80_16780 [Pseudomonas sp. Leaf15]
MLAIDEKFLELNWCFANMGFKSLPKSLSSPLFVAWVAIAVSVTQMVISFPLLTSFYTAPDLMVSGSGSALKAKLSNGTYTLKNTGRGNATNVELGLNVRLGDRVVVMPAVANVITTDKEPILFDHARIEFSRLLPGETVTILVIGNKEGIIGSPLMQMLEGAKSSIPSVSYLRSDQGQGQVKQTINDYP